MRRLPDTRRTQRWIAFNDFSINQKCKEKIISLFEYFDIDKYSFVTYDEEPMIYIMCKRDYMIGLDRENVCLKILELINGEWKQLYWKNFSGDTMWFHFLKWIKDR